MIASTERQSSSFHPCLPSIHVLIWSKPHLYYRYLAQVEPSTSVFPRHQAKSDSSPCFVRVSNCGSQTCLDRSLIKCIHASEVGFQVPEDRLPWFKLEEKLHERGYTILNWPGVIRENDKGVCSLSAENTAKLYCALFSSLPQERLQCVHPLEGTCQLSHFATEGIVLNCIYKRSRTLSLPGT
ncbi:hypothetical protein JVU11DRAFT_11694 [Chiua virens]|nr:hypothetical protein JVU11DRAFT_11694 [Chiua virens]